MPELKTGVYCIRNKANGKRYVGSSMKSIVVRWRPHKVALRARSHHNRYLQAAWDKYGEKEFVFAVLELCCQDDCFERETLWIAHYKSVQRDFGYNLCPVAGSPIGWKHSAETKAKLSAAKRGRKLTPAHYAKISAAGKGRKQSKEWVAKRVAFHRGKKRSQEACVRIGAKHKGKVISLE
jgi:group I intron endonuclease